MFKSLDISSWGQIKPFVLILKSLFILTLFVHHAQKIYFGTHLNMDDSISKANP